MKYKTVLVVHLKDGISEDDRSAIMTWGWRFGGKGDHNWGSLGDPEHWDIGSNTWVLQRGSRGSNESHP